MYKIKSKPVVGEHEHGPPRTQCEFNATALLSFLF